MTRTRYTLAACLALTLGGCQAGSQVLANAGVDPATATTIATDVATAGQLFCQYGNVLMAVVGVNVKGASAASVANACKYAIAVGATTAPATPPVPVAGPAGAQAVLATVPAAIAAVVKASQS